MSQTAGMPSSRLTAQWRCQKNASRSRSGLSERCMRSSHSMTSSSSEASGSIGWLPVPPVSGGVLVASCASGASSSQSTNVMRPRPVQAARCAAVGPKPARQNSRSTMAAVSCSPTSGAGSGGGSGPAGAAGANGAGRFGMRARSGPEGLPRRPFASTATTK